MNRRHGWSVGAAVLLAGCAPVVHPPAARATEEACGFRSPTSCWTLGPRYGPPLRQQADSAPQILQPPPRALAAAGDSTRRSTGGTSR
jgi:hypothetical protein